MEKGRRVSPSCFFGVVGSLGQQVASFGLNMEHVRLNLDSFGQKIVQVGQNDKKENQELGNESRFSK
ncbi:hypothetical protein LQ50_16945 [Halalkalibacter okhensis]|uniref:Uncharacterized protein n=1 Tax=Halalkalibacter okhensis TaxID=333138 RepID=A0A0B0IE04_9BACI|nr:hypothetical protein LQ50_16945 [Halalkalibacter okhensis]